ncbi:MAG TPA: cytochrome c [Cellvibrionaceae bacterium]
MNKKLHYGLGVLGLVLMGCSDKQTPVPEVTERDPMAEGAVKARVCMGCHGKQGVSRVASYPSIAGLDRDYLSKQLHDYRSGARENPMMNAMATSLSDEDIRLLALYFSSQRPQIESR